MPITLPPEETTCSPHAGQQRACCFPAFPGPQGQAMGSDRKPGAACVREDLAPCRLPALGHHGSRCHPPLSHTREGTLGFPNTPSRSPWGQRGCLPGQQGRARPGAGARGQRPPIKIFLEQICAEGSLPSPLTPVATISCAGAPYPTPQAACFPGTLPAADSACCLLPSSAGE